MMTTLSCWLLYIASYGIVYVIIALCVINNSFCELLKVNEFQSLSCFKQVVYVFRSEKTILILLSLLAIFSIIWTHYIKSWKNNSRIKYRMTGDSKIEESAFILPYIFTIITYNFDAYGWLICFFVYLSVGLLFVQSRKLQMSPIFILSRYHILTDGNNKVITRNTLEAFNLKLDDNPDGIEVRELAKHVYITLDQ